jgi:hypothetical protein
MSELLEYHQLVKLCINQSEEVKSLTEQVKMLEEQSRVMARWIIDTAEMGYGLDDVEDDCAYQYALEILNHPRAIKVSKSDTNEVVK